MEGQPPDAATVWPVLPMELMPVALARRLQGMEGVQSKTERALAHPSGPS